MRTCRCPNIKYNKRVNPTTGEMFMLCDKHASLLGMGISFKIYDHQEKKEEA